MTPREVFVAARECAEAIRRHDEDLELRHHSIGVQGHSYEAHTKHDILDPSRKIVDLLAWEAENSVTDLEAQVEEARTMARGIPDPVMAEITERFYCDAEPMSSIAFDVAPGIGALIPLPQWKRESYIRQAVDEYLKALDGIGVARLMDAGRGDVLQT